MGIARGGLVGITQGGENFLKGYQQQNALANEAARLAADQKFREDHLNLLKEQAATQKAYIRGELGREGWYDRVLDTTPEQPDVLRAQQLVAESKNPQLAGASTPPPAVEASPQISTHTSDKAAGNTIQGPSMEPTSELTNEALDTERRRAQSIAEEAGIKVPGFEQAHVDRLSRDIDTGLINSMQNKLGSPTGDYTTEATGADTGMSSVTKPVGATMFARPEREPVPIRSEYQNQVENMVARKKAAAQAKQEVEFQKAKYLADMKAESSSEMSAALKEIGAGHDKATRSAAWTRSVIAPELKDKTRRKNAKEFAELDPDKYMVTNPTTGKSALDIERADRDLTRMSKPVGAGGPPDFKAELTAAQKDVDEKQKAVRDAVAKKAKWSPKLSGALGIPDPEAEVQKAKDELVAKQQHQQAVIKTYGGRVPTTVDTTEYQSGRPKMTREQILAQTPDATEAEIQAYLSR